MMLFPVNDYAWKGASSLDYHQPLIIALKNQAYITASWEFQERKRLMKATAGLVDVQTR